uniref:Fungal lipase-type domain-containing protein n=1 Tax=Chromera velia CCMP2878 TaxID=1169474 RepID=A0A0G4H4V0_9ALVE|eukprot:Cvel_829.t1-p1 / transcript=Cvel_829.t1 / gene=Cvel_829 / organism=Chromera_velia_CCMP2878 / gene_product=hypothetical protein / transcript_product=hypothetical protein / location=Cvel_scaffold26:1717-5759(+) / protein_length=569 / sequence_SO=supercontig / SO=protein_coding / is_pseudo=false
MRSLSLALTLCCLCLEGVRAHFRVEDFTHPYPTSLRQYADQFNPRLKDHNAKCKAALPRLNRETLSFQSCVFRKIAGSSGVGQSVCGCAAQYEARDVCSFAGPVLDAAVCILSVVPLFPCNIKGKFPKEPLALVNSSTVDIPPLIDLEESLGELPEETPLSVQKAEAETYYVLYLAMLRWYAMGLDYMCGKVEEEAALDSPAGVLPSWTSDTLLQPTRTSGDPRGLSPFVALSRKGDTMLVTIRGTVQFPDELADLDFALAPHEFFDGHHVFRGSANIAAAFLPSVDRVVEDALLEKENPLKRVVVTGHSLGGFVASLATYHLTKTFADRGLKVEGVAFASGPVGDEQFNAALRTSPSVNLRTIQFELDPVTPMPCLHMPECLVRGGALTVGGQKLNNQTEPVLQARGKKNEKKDKGKKKMEDAEEEKGMPYAKPLGRVEFHRQEGGDFWNDWPNNHKLYIWADHICSYYCFVERNLKGKKKAAKEGSGICSINTCRRMDFSLLKLIPAILRQSDDDTDSEDSPSPSASPFLEPSEWGLDGDTQAEAEEVLSLDSFSEEGSAGLQTLIA